MPLNNGTLDYLSIGSMTVRQTYAAGSGSLTNWINLEGVGQFDLGDLSISVTNDASDSLTSANTMAFTAPASVTAPSTLGRLTMQRFQSDGSEGAFQMRGSNFAQEDIFASDVVWRQIGSNPYLMHRTYGEWRTSSGIPSGGYWRQGQILFDRAPVQGGRLGWVCTTAGSPGTWTEFGGIASATPMTVSNDNTQLNFNADTVTVETLADVVATLIKRLQTKGL